MSNLSKLEFSALDISGKNYLSWILDAEIHLKADSLGDTIVEGNDASTEDRSKALILLRRHLDESLKEQYLTVKDPYTLWMELKGRFDHQKSVILPRARYEWMHLRLQDFKSVIEYNSALFQIVSRLKLCGETITESDLLEKTYSTFHASNLVLQQQYRERQFKKYSELISCLLVAEQNNELLMQNHQTHPTGSSPIPIIEANANVAQSGGKRHEHGLGPKKFINKKKVGPNSYQKKGKKNETICHRCGSQGHWANVCRTPKHLVDLYKASVQAKNVETNFAQFEVPNENAHFDLPDFKATANHSEFDNIDTFIGDI
ncbi:uncharacterized protein LOC141653096 [Silene latifolia]|uniref:uncharacterized protein LOC141653096 n=1 Tax=Silene latifolia TaxID=37657 RepID=UPI003D77BA1F